MVPSGSFVVPSPSVSTVGSSASAGVVASPSVSGISGSFAAPSVTVEPSTSLGSVSPSLGSVSGSVVSPSLSGLTSFGGTSPSISTSGSGNIGLSPSFSQPSISVVVPSPTLEPLNSALASPGLSNSPSISVSFGGFTGALVPSLSFSGDGSGFNVGLLSSSNVFTVSPNLVGTEAGFPMSSPNNPSSAQSSASVPSTSFDGVSGATGVNPSVLPSVVVQQGPFVDEETPSRTFVSLEPWVPSVSPSPNRIGTVEQSSNDGDGSSSPVSPIVVGEKGNSDTGTENSGGGGSFPGGIGGMSGIAIASLAVVLVVGVVVYRSCAVFPDLGKALVSSPSESTNDDGGLMSSMVSFDSGGGEDDSPWAQVWRSASELSDSIVEMGQEAAAAVGGQFAGLLKPGAARVRPPQVITRLAVPGMCLALSQLSPDSICSDATSSSSVPSSDPPSFPSLSASSSSQEQSNSRLDAELSEHAETGAIVNEKPRLDLLFVFDASGALSWRDYRRMKEILSTPGGVIDNVQKRVHDGSRIGFVEYAYDSVVVSELDRDLDAVRRRILSSFQGDANNWDTNDMYIYEVGDEMWGNALRKVDSLVNDPGKNTQTISEGDIEEPPTVQATEVPPAMNGMCREAHLALKWSRYEMIPPAANKHIQSQLLNARRLRRVVLINAGELTKGGMGGQGVESALKEKIEMEKLGIRLVTIGIGESQDSELSKLGTGKSFLNATSTADVVTLVPKLVEMIIKVDYRFDGQVMKSTPVIRKRMKKSREKAKEKRRQVYNALRLKNSDPDRSIRKGISRRASELPPWFTDSDNMI
eukprot:TRINITY_DN1011_c0_g2_i9.p1 TRINITY_DN1011_c0_g2~~TRINITY_DN1011_c0_g2_i9.p1  ORF type:complete len:811 (+),score=118.83 TRINITY_DN1011_c0_g2_i9:1309-3741(+)